MGNYSWRDWMGLAARLVLGIALLWAGLSKVTRLAANVSQVKLFGLPIPDWLATVVGYLQPPIEIIFGLLLILGLFTRVSAAAATLAMIIFIFGIIWAWSHGLQIDCGCFSPGGELEPGEQNKYLQDIIRDAVLMAGGVWLVIRPSSVLSLDGLLFPPLNIDEG